VYIDRRGKKAECLSRPRTTVCQLTGGLLRLRRAGQWGHHELSLEEKQDVETTHTDASDKNGVQTRRKTV